MEKDDTSFSVEGSKRHRFSKSIFTSKPSLCLNALAFEGMNTGVKVLFKSEFQEKTLRKISGHLKLGNACALACLIKVAVEQQESAKIC
ncbi:hypothetical protein TNCV_3840061 [Trichonephila clavipes]|nr:hypothetical protein TNCV_3840061 [Trichonephila clavipes]